MLPTGMTFPTRTTRWHVAEFRLPTSGPRVVPAPSARPPILLRFSHPSGLAMAVEGFDDGDGGCVVRWAAPEEGRWEWNAESPHPELDGLTGVVDVDPAEGTAGSHAHGPVRAVGFHFAHADGTPFRPFGSTAYNLLHQSDDAIRETIDDLAAAGFNKLRFMVFPQAGDYVVRTPEVMPFERTADGGWDASRPVPEFFRRLDRTVELLGAAGIQAEVLLLDAYDNDAYGLNRLTEDEDARYLRHVVARLAAHPHVWWSLCNEYDLLDRPDERWDRAGELVRALDPYDHPRSIHNWRRLYDNRRPWITHSSIQQGQAADDAGRVGLFRDVYGKAVILDEICYEGDIALRWGRLTGRQLVHKFWTTICGGAYASHGESFEREDGSLHMVAGGRLQGESPRRIAFLRSILDEIGGTGLEPVDSWWDDEFVVGIPGHAYLLYLGDTHPGSWTFRLPQGLLGERLEPGQRYAVDVIDTWEMTVAPVDAVFELDEVGRNESYARAAESVALPPTAPVALRIRRLP